MRPINIDHHWIIDILYGLFIIIPIILYNIEFHPGSMMLFCIGVSVGYILHMSEKMLFFKDIFEGWAAENKSEDADDLFGKENSRGKN